VGGLNQIIFLFLFGCWIRISVWWDPHEVIAPNPPGHALGLYKWYIILYRRNEIKQGVKHKVSSWLSSLVDHWISRLFQLCVATRGFRESNKPDHLTRVTWIGHICVKYDDESSSDLTINLISAHVVHT
jgi:hypothetical protein